MCANQFLQCSCDAVLWLSLAKDWWSTTWWRASKIASNSGCFVVICYKFWTLFYENHNHSCNLVDAHFDKGKWKLTIDCGELTQLFNQCYLSVWLRMFYTITHTHIIHRKIYTMYIRRWYFDEMLKAFTRTMWCDRSSKCRNLKMLTSKAWPNELYIGGLCSTQRRGRRHSTCSAHRYWFFDREWGTIVPFPLKTMYLSHAIATKFC